MEVGVCGKHTPIKVWTKQGERIVKGTTSRMCSNIFSSERGWIPARDRTKQYINDSTVIFLVQVLMYICSLSVDIFSDATVTLRFLGL